MRRDNIRETMIDGEASKVAQELREKEKQLVTLTAQLKPNTVKMIDEKIRQEIIENSCTPPPTPSPQYYKHTGNAAVLLAVAFTLTPPALFSWPVKGVKAAAVLVWMLFLAELAIALYYRPVRLTQKTCTEETSPLLLRTGTALSPQLICSLALHRGNYMKTPPSIRRLCKLRQELGDPEASVVALARILGRRDLAQLYAEVERLRATLEALEPTRRSIYRLEEEPTRVREPSIPYKDGLRQDREEHAYAHSNKTVGGGDEYTQATLELLRKLAERGRALEERAKRLSVELQRLRLEIIRNKERARSNAVQVLRQVIYFIRAQPKIRMLVAASRASGINASKLVKKDFFILDRSARSLAESLHLVASSIIALSLILAILLAATYNASPRAATMLAAAIMAVGVAKTGIDYARHKRLLTSGAWITLVLLTLSMSLPIHLAASQIEIPREAIVLEWASSALGVFIMSTYALATIMRPLSQPISRLEALLAEEQVHMPCEHLNLKFAAPRNGLQALLVVVCKDLAGIDDNDLELIALYAGIDTYAKYERLVEVSRESEETTRQLANTQRAIRHLEGVARVHSLVAQKKYVEASLTLRRLAIELQDKNLQESLEIDPREAEAAASLLKTLSETCLALAFNAHKKAQNLVERIVDSISITTPEIYLKLVEHISREVSRTA